MRSSIFLLLFLWSGAALAHSWTPTYPEFIPSYVDGVYVTNMILLNKRKDVKYYSVEVFTKDFEEVKFVSTSTVYNVNYLQRKSIPIFVGESDLNRVTYICSRSEFIKEKVPSNKVVSRVCSKIKR